MKKFTATFLAAAVATAAFAPLAQAQTGYDTGAAKPSGSTTNSGEARPDAAAGGAGGNTGGSETMPTTRAAPTSATGSDSGSGMSRPDSSSSNVSGAPDAKKPKNASGTQTDD